ncbi:phytanoyl-CoA dioxygenase family protein [Pedobacter sp. WC2423]|uniref:phytanoyl-CoA dioxygenase family protein n=1 Tax=Pedobacter sp. WC2423 TaxID=3234142 RepID=UPI003467C3A1
MLSTSLTPSQETGKLQVMHLKRFWEKSLLKREGKVIHGELKKEWRLDKILMSALGLGLEQTSVYLFETVPGFEEFEDWIIETAGMPVPETIARYNNEFGGNLLNKDIPDVLSDEQLKSWDQNGYLILKNAVSKKECDETIEVICQSIKVKREEPGTWYQHHASRQGIMVQLFQHPVIQKNRESAIIRQAYEQLWNRTDLWCTADRVGFNPPETAEWRFPGPHLHWDVSLSLPVPFGLQGILYLADTASNQGALTVVPGFQNRIENWMSELPAGANPRQQDLHALGSFPIAADAGDFIIWHHALPHGSSPNTSQKPRFVQYINYEPLNLFEAEEWI